MSHLRRLIGTVGLGLVGVGALVVPSRVSAQEPAACLSPDPKLWPASSRPYFMLVVDTSGSMIGCTNPSTSQYQWPNSCPSTAPLNSCQLEPTRLNDAKCALKNTVQAFAGEVNFGLSTFAVRMFGCTAGACTDTCTAADGTCPGLSAGVGTLGEYYAGKSCGVLQFPDAPSGTPAGTELSCGNKPNCAGAGPAAPNFPKGTWRNGGNIVVDLLQNPTWGPAPPASNVPEILKWFDGDCSQSKEIFAIGNTPIAGSLRTSAEYLRAGWNILWDASNYCSGTTYTSPTPMDANDRACRSVNVLLVTDGDEGCDGDAEAVAAAADLFNNGVTLGGKNWKVRTHVIGFAGATKAKTDAIAAAGGTTTSLIASNETQLSQALATIISGAIKPEICNNGDDNCNGCTDEGYKHYCNQRAQCCAWSDDISRNACLTTYQGTITPGNPQGDLTKLPCTTPIMQSQPPNWLCFDPKEECDGQDDNCDGQIDEGFNRCGNPLHCPIAESCNSQDDDCDGIVDNAVGSAVPFSICPGGCTPVAEICDGCDNDCDGVADDGVADIPCGVSPPANCAGVKVCLSKGVSVGVGGCVGPGVPKGFGNCNNNPQPEICDTLDNDCDGTINEGIPPTPCEVPGQPGLVYQDTFAASQCVKGQQPCNGTCSGYVGPSTEICDGKDNDCDGVVDDGVPGTGQPCGIQGGICTKGTTACVGGALICQGGTQPQPEQCNGIDDDCDGKVDDAPLADAPPNAGCWTLPAGTCNPACAWQNAQWCPPAGATCTDKGTLTAPCAAGTLVCNGNLGWKCQGGKAPTPEVCDGSDNNCNGQTDENPGAPVGEDCGNTTPPCTPGKNVCVNGKIECQGGVKPGTEICNGIDDDCNGIKDDGLGLGGPCVVPYDTTKFPGDRDKGICKPGVSQCDPAGTGNTICVGGQGPQDEICDGIDNDCDGQVDEPGAAPDGINGSTNPGNPNQHIGDACGVNKGECKEGKLVCDAGKFVCAGGVGPQPEQCDCLDNDCDGEVDNETGSDGGADAGPAQPLCTPGKTCVQVKAGLCQCALPCKGEICPGGLKCENVTKSGSTDHGNFCVNDPCGDCSKQTVKDIATGQILCGPGATSPAGTPVCICKGTGCKSPCEGITCPTGQACAILGPSAGTCQPENNCYFFGCQAGEACNNGACVDDPCEPNPCNADEVCKPNTSFTEARCVGSCATLVCKSGEVCVEGLCTATGCGSDCPNGQYCQSTGDETYACGPDKCVSDAGQVCTNGAYCDPATGSCGNDPCTGVKCPTAQECIKGECFWAPEGGTGGTGGGGAGGTGAKDGGAAAGGQDGGGATGGSGTGGGTPKPEEKGVWGLATGGGGCACTAAGERDRMTPFAIALFGAAAWVVRLRRRKRQSLEPRKTGGGLAKEKGDLS